jgi:hypothetical protein
MKRLLTIVLVLALALTLAACGGNTNTPAPTVLDLSGGWQQTNSNSDTSYQIAMIADGTIEVYWKSDDDSTSLYWAGTYIAPTSETNEYSWDSANDKSRTDTALLASGDDTKTFTHKDGTISYSVSAMGVTTTVELKRSDDVNIQVQKVVPAEDLLPLELVDSGYAVKDGHNTYYIQYAIGENAHFALDQGEYQERYNGLVDRFDLAKARHTAVTEEITGKQTRLSTINAFLYTLRKQNNLLTEFDEKLWCSLVDYATVYDKDDVRFTFKDGKEIQA